MAKCPSCGAENPTSSPTCSKCGRLLAAERNETTKSYAKPPLKVDHEEIARKMRLDYLQGAKDKNERALEAIISLFSHFQKPQMHLDALLLDAANIIYKQLGIANVGVGLKTSTDGMFRYKVLVGFRTESETALRKLAYTEAQFTEDGEYKGTMISKISKLYLAENSPYKDTELSSYDRSALLGMRRLSPSDSLEADYIDTWITGVNGRILGWIEVSGTKTGKIPDIQTIRRIELIASVIGAAIARHSTV